MTEEEKAINLVIIPCKHEKEYCRCQVEKIEFEAEHRFDDFWNLHIKEAEERGKQQGREEALEEVEKSADDTNEMIFPIDADSYICISRWRFEALKRGEK